MTEEDANEILNTFFYKAKACAIMITDKCNMSCKICFRGCNSKNKQVISYKMIKDIVSKLDSSWCVAITGGEPTLYLNKTLYLIKLCKKKGIQTRLKTNGFWPIGAIWRIKRAAPDILCIGVNGFNKKIYSRLNKILGIFSNDKVKTKVMLNTTNIGHNELKKLKIEKDMFIMGDPVVPNEFSTMSTLEFSSSFTCEARGILIDPKGNIKGQCFNKYINACSFGNIKDSDINKVSEIFLKRRKLIFKTTEKTKDSYCEPIHLAKV